MKLTWVNHASFVVSHRATKLVCDPWLYGSAFDDGWDLLAKTSFTAADLAGVTHIWYSHEHPDHFAPRILKDIPADARKRIEVLYQDTRDGKVLDFCRQQGFRTRALRPDEAISLGDDVRITCGTVPFYDSWLLIEADGKRLLNLNDCVVDDAAVAEGIRRKVGAIDVLFTQFNWAEWMGNPDQPERRQQCAAEKRRRIQLQIAAFRPVATVPFASYFYFSHHENFHQNDGMNRVDDIAALIEAARSVPVVMYPGDEWEVGARFDNGPALARYRSDVARAQPIHESGASVPVERLLELAGSYRDRLSKKNSRLFVWLASGALGILPPIRLHLWDLEQTVQFDWRNGLRPVQVARADADVALHSSSLAFVLRFDWGMDTLTVNGRFQASERGYRRFMKAFALGSLNNVGRTFGPQLLLDREFLKRALSLGKKAKGSVTTAAVQ
jgi:Beta-lactamase superfamily domain